MSEIWKDLPGFKGHYRVSSFGRVKTVKKKRSQCKHPEGILTPEITRLGYLRLNLHKNNIRARPLVHRCVMLAFNKLEDGKEVNHKDGDKSNNNLKNLECVTRSEQIKHAFKLGLLKPMRGEKNPASKYSIFCH